MGWESLIVAAPLYADRRDAGRALAAALDGERGPELVVVGLARGGVEIAAEVARVLAAPLDLVAVRKVGHPLQPEYGLGAVTADGAAYIRGDDVLSEDQLAKIVDETKAEAAALDRRLHAENAALDLRGKTALLVDDGLATGATMIAALRWARVAGAARVAAAIPVAAVESLDLVRPEADEVVCLHALDPFFAVGVWYASFAQVDDEDVVRLIDENRRALTRSVAPERLVRS